MKHLLVYLLFLGTVFAVNAQSVSKLTIMKAIKDDFPKSENVEVSMQCGSYEATFYQNNAPVKVCYSQNGKLQHTTYLIEPKGLPKEARNYIENNFASLNISEILKKENTQNEIEYLVRFEDRSRLYFDKNGERLQMYSNCRNKTINN